MRTRRVAFTLLELMITLGIIVILVSILIPTVKKVRQKAQETTVKSQIASLAGAVDRYQMDFGSYPGPLPRSSLGPNATNPGITDAASPNGTGTQLQNITGGENLVLGLVGGLKPGNIFDKTIMGRGPRGFNPANPKTYPAYIDGMPLSEAGKNYSDGGGTARDSFIPEFLDKFPSPMPILYLRAQIGAGGVASNEGNDTNGAVIPGTSGPGPTQYDIREILGYVDSNGSIGEGKTIKRDLYRPQLPAGSMELPHGLKTVNRDASFDKGNSNYTYPYDAFPYFQNRAVPPTDPAQPNRTGTPRMKDKYVLISAGVDRVYGTEDDITNFGSVLE